MADADIIDLPDALTSLGLPADSAHQGRVAGMITGISQHVDKLCGPVVQRSITETHGGSSSYVLLRTPPVAEITEVVETVGVTPTTLDAEDYLLEAQGVYAMLHRRSSGYATVWASGDFNLAVTYVAGRFEATEDVDEFWKSGCRSILVQRWQRESSQWSRNPTGDEYLPDGPFDMLAAIRATFPYDLLPPGVA